MWAWGVSEIFTLGVRFQSAGIPRDLWDQAHNSMRVLGYAYTADKD